MQHEELADGWGLLWLDDAQWVEFENRHRTAISLVVGPFMLAEGVTMEAERFFRSTVSELAETLDRDPPSTAPALIFYGALAPEMI